MPGKKEISLPKNWYWLAWCIIVWLALAVVYFLVPGFWQSPIGGFLLFCNFIVLPVFFLVREALRKRDREDIWRENKWIILPGAIIILFFTNSILASVYLREADFRLETKSYRTGSCTLRLTKPAFLFYKDDLPQKIALRLTCESKNTRAEIRLKSETGAILFADSPDSVDWVKEKSYLIQGDGRDLTLYMRREDNFGTETFISVGGAFSEKFYIKLENLREAKIRLYLANLFQLGGTLISLIGIAVAGFKQLDEQKRNQEKTKIDLLIDRVKNFKYENGKIESLVTDVLSELDDWNKWEQDQKDRFIRSYRELTTSKVSESQWWQEAAQAQSKVISIALAIAGEVFSNQYKPPILSKIQQKLPSYRPERAAVHFPLEIYPLEAQFRRQPGQPLPEKESQERWGAPLWDMRFAPFGDVENPFQYWQNEKTDLPRQFPLLDSLKFPFGGYFQSQTHYFLTSWDVRAALYRYGRSLYDFVEDNASRKTSQQTFFVPVLPGISPVRQDGLCPEIYLLNGLADAWLRALAHNPYIIDKHTPIEQEMLASLLLWKYQDAFVIKNALIEQAERSAIPLSPSSGFLQLLEKTRPADPASLRTLAGLLALRPRETECTIFLCAETSLSGSIDPAFSIYLRALPDQPDIPDAFLVRFLLKSESDSRETLSIDLANLKEFLDSRLRLTHSPCQTFDGLFYPPPPQDALEAFIARADGSPGILVQMSRNLLLRHIEQPPGDPDIPPEALLE